MAEIDMATIKETIESDVLLHDNHAFDAIFNFWKSSIRGASLAYEHATQDEKPFRYIDLAMVVSMCDKSSKAFIDDAFLKEAIWKLPVYVRYFDKETEKDLYKQTKATRSWILAKENKLGFTPDKISKEIGGIPKEFISKYMSSGPLAEGLKAYAASAKKVIHRTKAYDAILEDISQMASERLIKAKRGFPPRPYNTGQIEKWEAYNWVVEELAFPYMIAMKNNGLAIKTPDIVTKNVGSLPLYYQPAISDSTNPPHLQGCWTPAAMYLLAETMQEPQEKFEDKVFSVLRFAQEYYSTKKTYSPFSEPRKASFVKVFSAYPSQWAFLDDYVGLAANISSIRVPDGNPLRAFESPYMHCSSEELPAQSVRLAPARKMPPGRIPNDKNTLIVNKGRVSVLQRAGAVHPYVNRPTINLSVFDPGEFDDPDEFGF